MAEQERVQPQFEGDKAVSRVEMLQQRIRDLENENLRLQRKLDQRDKTIAEQRELATIARELLSQIKIEMAEKDAEIVRLRKERDEYKRFVEQSKAGLFTYKESRERASLILARQKAIAASV